jgi:hypothetical protein
MGVRRSFFFPPGSLREGGGSGGTCSPKGFTYCSEGGSASRPSFGGRRASDPGSGTPLAVRRDFFVRGNAIARGHFRKPCLRQGNFVKLTVTVFR